MSWLIDISKRIQGKDITKAEKELAAKRLEICSGCKTQEGKSMVISITGQCKECWCILDDKVTYQDEECPLGKW